MVLLVKTAILHGITRPQIMPTWQRYPTSTEMTCPYMHLRLGVPWYQDFKLQLIEQAGKCDWLIVDDYAIDWRWEQTLRNQVNKIMVIDGLADRKHDCEIWLDPVPKATNSNSQHLAPASCRFLLGTDFVPLRPEFIQWRSCALEHRKNMTRIKRVLITLGGSDPDNITGVVLQQLAQVTLPDNHEIDVILGSNFPYVEEIKKQIECMPVKTNLVVYVDNMAEYMTRADLAIGAGGVTVWERCCLGLPSIYSYHSR